ncbi:MAG: co-chaperone GroES [Hyphomicrobiales bacterium]|uniref:Co-chaperonin GroES n=1 Tax=OCS116 cluster bacterium TaxID=2030921 RepID=A0A2A4Z8U1_9PROT|nr:co-chaperone GroES [Alphaproteobacteria bacterium]PCI85924.1 MAG: co-chaperone GroES [Hyphomicrobiales bacterium]
MALRPLQDRVLVRTDEAETKTASGLIIVDSAQDKPSQGTVVSVGNGTRNAEGALIALEVKAGDTVLFGKWSGTEIKVDGEELMIMKEADILGIVE